MQAIDLVFRKVLSNKILNKFIKLIRHEIKKNKHKELQVFSEILEEKIIILEKFAKWLEEKLNIQKDDVSASCNDFLKILGYVSLGFAWLKMSRVSIENSDKNKNFYEEKINTAKYYFDKIIPRIDSHYQSALAGSESIMNAKFN